MMRRRANRGNVKLKEPRNDPIPDLPTHTRDPAGDRLRELFVMGELFGAGVAHNNSGHPQSQSIFCEVSAFSGGGREVRSAILWD
jgi:hypothetical protein